MASDGAKERVARGVTRREPDPGRMKNLYDQATAAEVKSRLARLTPQSPRQWGRMTAAQAVAHLARGMEMATGDRQPSRLIAGRLFGSLVKLVALKDDAPFKRNSPTDPALIVTDDPDLEAERARLLQLIDRFVTAGPAAARRTRTASSAGCDRTSGRCSPTSISITTCASSACDDLRGTFLAIPRAP